MPPRKPTLPYGAIVFSKDGRVTPDIKELPGDKQAQQNQVMSIFISQLAQLGTTLPNARPLPENDFDFHLETVDGLFIELTELVERTFASKMEGGDGYMIDRQAEAAALPACIQSKLDKNYQKPANGRLWLVIFSTWSYATEYWRAGQRMHSAGLVAARELLAHNSGPFDEVWFTDLQTNPVRVWPA